jgi:hypothetical protein
MGIFSQAKAIVLGAQADTDNTKDTNNADASRGSGLKQASTAAASMALGVVGTLGALSVPSLLPSSDGPLKLSPNIGAMSVDELGKLGIRPVLMEGIVGVVNQEEVKEGTLISFELKAPGADQGIEVSQLLKGFNDEAMYSMTRHFLKEMSGKPKNCLVEGYIARSIDGDRPVFHATTFTLTDPNTPVELQHVSTGKAIAGWSFDDGLRMAEYVKKELKGE